MQRELSRLQEEYDSKLGQANEHAEKSASAAQAAALELEDKRLQLERAKGDLDECYRRLEGLGIDAISLKKWTAVSTAKTPLPSVFAPSCIPSSPPPALLLLNQLPTTLTRHPATSIQFGRRKTRRTRTWTCWSSRW